MHDKGRKPGKPPQGLRVIKVAVQRGDALRTQLRPSGGRRGERHHRQRGRQLPRHAKADIAATDDQNALAAKPRGQRAKGTLV